MKPQTQAGLMLVSALAIGILLGAVGVGAWAQFRNRQITGIRAQGGFVTHMESVIQPRDESQRQALRPFLEATDQMNRDIVRESEDDLRSAMTQLRTDLADILDPDQMDRLERETLRQPPPGGRGRGGRGGPPPPRGGEGERGRPPGEGPPRGGAR